MLRGDSITPGAAVMGTETVPASLSAPAAVTESRARPRKDFPVPQTRDSAFRDSVPPDTACAFLLRDSVFRAGADGADTVLYYRKNFFTESAPYPVDRDAARQGVPGDPVPYSIATDNFMTSLLVLFLIATIVVVSARSRFLLAQTRLFFYRRRGGSGDEGQPGPGEMRGMWFLAVQTCVMYAMIYFMYLRVYVAGTFTIEQYELIGVLFAIFAAFFLLKAWTTSFVNWTFFDSESRREFASSAFFLLGAEGLFLMPAVYVQAYFGLSFEKSVFYIFLVLILFRLLTIYKQKQIFFRQKVSLLGFCLYLCTLEIAPFFMVWNVLAVISGNLKIIFE